MFDEKRYGYALTDIENIFVFSAIRRSFFFQAVAVQVENIHLVECIHQALPHAPESGVVQIAVIGNHADNTCSGHVDFPLGKTDKFDIIILQPFWIFFSKWLPVYLIVAFNTIEVFLQKFFGPIVLIFRMSAVGWIAKDNQNGFLFFYFARQMAFFAQRTQSGYGNLPELLHFQRVGKVEFKPFVVIQPVTEFFEKKTHFQMTDGVRSHHEFESIKVLENPVFDKIGFTGRTVFSGKFIHGCFHGFGRKCECTCGGVEQRNIIACKTVGDIEMRFEKAVDRVYDILHNRFGSIIYATFFPD